MSNAKSALIGYTGFVGGNLLRQHQFDALYNSANIRSLGENEYDLIVCAAPSAVKWKANKDPEADLAIIQRLTGDLKSARTRRFVHISTVDVYGNPVGVDEDTLIDTANLHPYGKHRVMVEDFIKSQFPDHLIVRLPALFGEGLKKNLVYDLLNNNSLELQDADSQFQFYSLDHLWADINRALSHSIRTLNITSEPVTAREVAVECFGMAFDNRTGKAPAKYDVRSRHTAAFGGRDGYLYSKAAILDELKRFVEHHR